MFDRRSKGLLFGLMIMSLFVPIAVMLWKPEFGWVAWLLGFFTAWQCVSMIRLSGADDSEEKRYDQRDRSQTILVQLVDDQGHDLPPDVARARLNAAQMAAGPRDTVLGVRRKVE